MFVAYLILAYIILLILSLGYFVYWIIWCRSKKTGEVEAKPNIKKETRGIILSVVGICSVLFYLVGMYYQHSMSIAYGSFKFLGCLLLIIAVFRIIEFEFFKKEKNNKNIWIVVLLTIDIIVLYIVHFVNRFTLYSVIEKIIK